MKGLPNFREVTSEYVTRYAEQVFGEHLVAVDGRGRQGYRALFAPGYFTIQPGKTAPSRSQWSTLKKHMKRVNPIAFVLKDHGDTAHNGETVHYVDFGFLKD